MIYLILWLWSTWLLCGLNFGFAPEAIVPVIFITIHYICRHWGSAIVEEIVMTTFNFDEGCEGTGPYWYWGKVCWTPRYGFSWETP